MKILTQILKYLLSILFIAIGITHFTKTAVFVKIMPSYIPFPEFCVYLSGVAEISGGIGILVPFLRKYAGWGLILLLIAVFPANINMAINNVQLPGAAPMSAWMLWARLPLQFVLIYWVWFICLRKN